MTKMLDDAMSKYYEAQERTDDAVISLRDAYLEVLEALERLEEENAELRELVRDMWRDGMCDCDEQYTCAECCEYHYHERMCELGIEVEP